MKHKTTKTKQNSTTTSKVATRPTGDHQALFSWKERPVSNAFLNNLSSRIMEETYANEDILTIEDVLIRFGFSKDSVKNWSNRSPAFAYAYSIIKMIIGNRRHRGALLRKLDPAVVMRTMPLYNDDYTQLEEWRAKLKEKQNDNSNITVVIEKFPETDIVPKKKEKE